MYLYHFFDSSYLVYRISSIRNTLTCAPSSRVNSLKKNPLLVDAHLRRLGTPMALATYVGGGARGPPFQCCCVGISKEHFGGLIPSKSFLGIPGSLLFHSSY